MEKPIFTGLSHVCIFVDDVEEAFKYYERILGAVPNQYIPHWKNKGFFRREGLSRRQMRETFPSGSWMCREQSLRLS